MGKRNPRIDACIARAAGFAGPILLCALALVASASARDVPVPEPLRPWKAWVLERHPEHPCPALPDQSRLCAAYSSLDLDLGDRGGTFRMAVTVYGTQWAILPGDAQHWPMGVASRGRDVAVVLREGRPQARLEAGDHVLAGRLAWEAMPGSLGVPPRLARVSLGLRGRAVASPEVGGDGRLLLESRAAKPDSGAASVPLAVRVYRKLSDGVPMRLETHIRLAVSGEEREIVTGRLLPEGTTPLGIDGDLPARAEPGGRLRVQLVPGDHTLRVDARFLALPEWAAMERIDSLWPAEETWVFEARRDIRVVELSGAPLIDPSQTGLPEAWKSLPAFRLAPGDTLRLHEKQRGDPNPQAGALNLDRTLWLDFSGRGFTQKDRLHGELFRRTRLEMRPGFELGRAELDGKPVMITASETGAGIEVPAGRLDLTALSRVGRGGAMDATGWTGSFQGMNLRLNLPPGWRLLHAHGPDRIRDSWLSGWSLWDVFLLCILTLAILKLLGMGPAVLAFATFALLSQEPGLNGLLWLNLLAALGLCRVLPPGRLLRAASFYRWASLAVLAAAWIPFAIVHARKALYPQLDGPAGTTYGYANVNLLESADASGAYGGEPVKLMLEGMAEPAETDDEAAGEAPAEAANQAADASDGRLAKPAAPPPRMPRKRALASARQGMPEPLETQPYAMVQSGPGEPAWNWSSASLSWSGPVSEGERLRLLLVPPWLWRLVRALQALLPGLLLLLLAAAALPPGGTGAAGNPAPPGSSGSPGSSGKGGFRFPRLPFFRSRRAAGPGMALLLLAGAAPIRAEFPSPDLLAELERRLTAPPDCAPACVSMNAATIQLTERAFRVTLLLDAADTAVATLPQAGPDQWALASILLDERVEAAAARLPSGSLAAVVPPGRHRITMAGSLLGDRLELAFGEETHNLAVVAPGFTVQGLSGNRAESGTLVFQRRERAAGAPDGSSAAAPGATTAAARRALTPDPVIPFVEVRRTLSLGQEWFLDTRVVRTAPRTGAFAVEIPLMPFENPLSAAMSRDRGKTLASFQEGQDEVAWRSAVPRSESLVFAAGDVHRWSEAWLVQATSRWHLESDGPAPVQAAPGRSHVTEWLPFPGDTLRLRISEPKAARGPVKTVESATLTFAPGRREGRGTLALSYRAGQGDMGQVTLPEGARLDNLRVNGAPQPLTQREGRVVLPLQPGLQSVELEWRQPGGIGLVRGTPRVVLGDAAANVSIALQVPQDRWVLWLGGPSAGPALLLWGVLAVLGVLAFGLGRARVTPLGVADWALLFLGTSTVNVYAAAPLLLLFLGLRAREARAAALSPAAHNLVQLVLGFLALAAFGSLVASVPQGLLSAPDMQVTGNGSSATLLRWFQDRAEGPLPAGWMLSAPLWAYRVAMLAWSLWLAFRLLKWLRWCWERFSSGGIWKEFKAGKAGKPAKPAES